MQSWIWESTENALSTQVEFGLASHGDRTAAALNGFYMGLNLKYWRVQAGMTLEQLATDTGLTKSYLSKIERGLNTPSIAAALSIAKSLNVSVEGLFGQSTSVDPITIVRAVDGEAGDPEAHLSLVAGTGPQSAMRAFIVRPKAKPTRGRIMSHHPGEEILFVLSGTIQIQIGKRQEVLKRGDCIQFDSTIPHKLIALTEAPAAALVVIVNNEHRS